MFVLKKQNLSCFSVSLVDDSDVELFVREFDVGFVEAFLGCFADIKEYIPVIGVLAPRTAAENYAVVGSAADTNGLFHILNDFCVGGNDVHEYLLCFFEIFFFGNFEFEVNTSEFFFGIVDYAGSGSYAVGNVNDLVVEGADLGVADVDVFDNARISGEINIIVDLEGTGDKKENAACNVGKSAVDCETDAYAERSDESGDSAGVDSEIADKANGNDDLKSNFAYIDKGACDGFVELAFFLVFLFELSGNDVDTGVHYPVKDAGPNGIPIHNYTSI